MTHYIVKIGESIEEHNFATLQEGQRFVEARRQPEHQHVSLKEKEYPHLTHGSTWHVSNITGIGHWTDWHRESSLDGD